LKAKDIGLLLALTLGAMLVQGYHPMVEDAEIYLPGVERILHPELFPTNTLFFESHAHLTLFPNLVAASVRWSHLPLEAVLLVWQLLAVFLLLLACWQLSGKLFTERMSRWAGVALVAALLTLPVAGTALYIMDQYTNPRNLTAFAGVLAIAFILDNKYLSAALVLCLAAAVHPLMAVFGFAGCAGLTCLRQLDLRRDLALLGLVLPFGISLQPPPPAYHQVALLHSYHYLLRWRWYEWLGVAGPLLLFWTFSRLARQRKSANLDLLCRTLIILELACVAAAVVLSWARFESLARLQPMRSLHLFYILFLLCSGGLLGDYVLKNRVTRWLALFVPLCAGMFLAQRALFPNSAHLEWPGRSPQNSWAQSFLWIRGHTPADALFALDPYYMEIAGEDEFGFRATAQRSRLADVVKDSGAVSMFPTLADQWLDQVDALRGWKNFQTADFERLKVQYGVSWIVLQQPATTRDLDCPYQNAAARVCRL